MRVNNKSNIPDETDRISQKAGNTLPGHWQRMNEHDNGLQTVQFLGCYVMMFCQLSLDFCLKFVVLV